MLKCLGWVFISKPFFDGAVEPFQFPEGLWVTRRRVEQHL
jgi:hypothetical protein